MNNFYKMNTLFGKIQWKKAQTEGNYQNFHFSLLLSIYWINQENERILIQSHYRMLLEIYFLKVITFY